MRSKYLLFITLCLLSGVQGQGRDQVCKYQLNYQLTCSSSQVVDIKNEMWTLANNELTNQWERRFPFFKWSAQVKDGILPEQVFNSFQFINIEFDSSNLEKMHSEAFSSMYRGTISWKQTAETKLKNFPDSDYDLYKAFGKLRELQILSISLDREGEHEIPNNAFAGNSWDQLREVSFSGGVTVSRIGDNLISDLGNSFGKMSFDFVNILRIGEKAFVFSKSVYLSLKSCQLSDERLERGVFDLLVGSVELHLENNKFELLLEESFGRFLSNSANRLFFSANPLKCLDKTSYQWLLDRQSLRGRVVGALCPNGQSIWDFDWDSVTQRSTERTTRRTTESTDELCNKDGHYNGQFGVDRWPPVPPGHFSTVECSTGGEIRWECLQSGDFDPLGPDFGLCWLDELLEKNITSVEIVEECVAEMVEKTQNSSSLTSIENLGKVLRIVSKLENFMEETTIESSAARNLSEGFVVLFSQTIGQSGWRERRGRVRTASDLLSHIQRTAFLTNSFLSKDFEFISNNIFEKVFQNFSQSFVFGFNSSQISVPQRSDFEGVEGSLAMGAVINSLSDFLSDSSTLVANSHIIAFALNKSTQSHELREGSHVRVKLRHKNDLHLGDRAECGFWDFSALRWSSKGCHLVLQESSREWTVCECDHLTNFAAIMDISGREDNSLPKHVLTLVCCSLSIVCLVLTIALIVRRDLFLRVVKRKKKAVNEITRHLMRRRDFIVLNQSLSLLLSHLLIVGLMDRTRPPLLCRVSSFLLLFSLLSSFAWMSLNGIHLFRMTKDVFHSPFSVPLLLLCGYLLPLLLILVGLLALLPNSHSYFDPLVANEFFCWISSPREPNNVWLLIGPALLSIVANAAIVVFLVKVVKKRQLVGFALLSVNLGVTWLLFLAYMQRRSSAPQIFSFLFVLLNGSQGFFALLYQTLIALK